MYFDLPGSLAYGPPGPTNLRLMYPKSQTGVSKISGWCIQNFGLVYPKFRGPKNGAKMCAKMRAKRCAKMRAKTLPYYLKSKTNKD